jgi:hypothetical protein
MYEIPKDLLERLDQQFAGKYCSGYSIHVDIAGHQEKTVVRFVNKEVNRGPRLTKFRRVNEHQLERDNRRFASRSRRQPLNAHAPSWAPRHITAGSAFVHALTSTTFSSDP